MKPISDDDRALAAAFLDGELREPERTRFELRLSADPDLAGEVERLLATDELVRRRTRKAVAPRRGLRLVPLLACAAAAAAVLVAVLRVAGDPQVEAGAAICLRPGYESASEWLRDAPALRGLRPPGLDELRGPGQAPDADPRAFVEAARRIELGAIDAAPSAPATAGFYSIPVRLAAPADVVVAAFPARGEPRILRPASGASARLAAGEHVLPSPSFELVEDAAGPRVVYRRGFLVPVGAESVQVLVGVRAASPGALDAALLAPALSADVQRDLWSAAGFDVRAFSVREP